MSNETMVSPAPTTEAASRRLAPTALRSALFAWPTGAITIPDAVPVDYAGPAALVRARIVVTNTGTLSTAAGTGGTGSQGSSGVGHNGFGAVVDF